jgi:hypothetical protein
MPPHLHRRPSLRKPMPPPGRVLLLPPHHAKTHRQPETASQPPIHLPPAFTRRSLRPPAHRRQRHRSPPRRPPPLRPPDRQPQPPQTSNPHQNRNPDRRRDHHRPRPRRPGPAHRYLRDRKAQKRCRPAHRAHAAKQRRRTNPRGRTDHPSHPPGHRRQSSQHRPSHIQTSPLPVFTTHFKRCVISTEAKEVEKSTSPPQLSQNRTPADTYW